jgi:uncharacterized protein (DUF58 family)
MPASAKKQELSFFKRYLWWHYYAFSGVSHGVKRRVTWHVWFLMVAFFALGLMAVDPSVNVAYQGIVFLALVLGLAPFLSYASRSRFSASRRLPRYGSVGSELVYTVTVTNERKKTQRGVFIGEDLPDPRPSYPEFALVAEPEEESRNWWDRRYLFYRWMWLIDQRLRADVKESPCSDLAPQDTADVPMRMTPTRRGMLRLERISVACPDPFGLFRSLVKVDCADQVLILPKRYPVSPLALPGAEKYQQGGVSLASSIGESEEFVSLRDYRPGDPMKKIHWPSWARTGRPIVKEFVAEFFVRHGLILDTFTDQPYGAAFEEAVSVAASFACTLKDRDTLLDLMVVGPQAFKFTLGRGVGHIEKLLEVLAGVQACLDRSFAVLENLAMRHARELSGCLCVFLSWDEERQLLVKRLRQMRIPVRVLVVRSPDDQADLEPGPLADEPANLISLNTDRIAEDLAKLES